MWETWVGKIFPREDNGNPLQYSCLKNPMDRGAWRATVHGFEYSQTQLSNEAQHMELFSFKMGVILTTLKSCYKDEITTL